jgi:hypothetical protein
MSWDATLIDDRGHVEGDWNYTHNCNGMANAVLYDDYEQQSVFDEVFRSSHPSWWKVLDGMNGQESVAFLQRIIDGLEAQPARFRAMNPDNGWGNYDQFLALLKKMRDSVPTDWPTAWSVSG